MIPNDDTIDFAKVPVSALRQRARFIISRSLNLVKILPSEDGFPRDWRGFAHLAGLQSLYGPVINSESDPMSKVLKLWCTEGDNETANFDNLIKFLGVIDRWDVADDLSELLIEDAQAYKVKQSKVGRELSLATDSDTIINDIPKSDANILTKDDVERAQLGLPPQQYDAFVLFADDDINFATEVIERLEVDHPRFGFKLCLKDRDLIGGISFEHEAIMRLIAERCNRLIVIVSSAFLKSSANTFFVNFAQALQIEQRRRKIVPCLYESCILPPSLSFYFHLKYNQSGKLFNFWDKLSDSIRSTTTTTSNKAIRDVVVPSIQITDINDHQIPTINMATTPTAVTDPPLKMSRRKDSRLTVEPLKIYSKPDPQIRNAFSMIQLDAQIPNDPTASPQSLPIIKRDKNLSESNLSTISETKSSRRKSKWYKKLLSSSNSTSNTKLNSPISSTPAAKSCESISKPKIKKNWLKKRLTTGAS